jgi:hypothetical protein
MKKHIQSFGSFNVNEGARTMRLPSEESSWTFDLDIFSPDLSPEEHLLFFTGAMNHNVLVSIDSWGGPGGGMPVVTLTGSATNVKSFLYDLMGEEAEELIDNHEYSDLM